MNTIAHLITANQFNYYKEAINFFRDFLNSALKTNEELSKFDGIWQLMVYNGYLKINEKLSNDEYMIKIPNYEIQTFFKKGFIDKFLVSGKKRGHLKVKM